MRTEMIRVDAELHICTHAPVSPLVPCGYECRITCCCSGGGPCSFPLAAPYRSLSLTNARIKQSSEEDIGLHDVAFISNPFSPYTPGEAEGGQAPTVEVAGGSVGGSDGGSISAQGGGGGKGRVGGASAPRIAALTARHMRHVM